MLKIMPVVTVLLIAGCAGVRKAPKEPPPPSKVAVHAMVGDHASGAPLVTDEQVRKLMARYDGFGAYSIWVLLDGEGQRSLAVATRGMAGERLAVRFGDQWFATRPLRGANLDGLIEVPAHLPRSEAAAIVERWEKSHRRPVDFR